MEHPSPKTPPKWGLGLGRIGLAGQRLMDGDKENNRGEGSRPVSLGLYDQDGFLRSSPEREAVKAKKESRLLAEEKIGRRAMLTGFNGLCFDVIFFSMELCFLYDFG